MPAALISDDEAARLLCVELLRAPGGCLTPMKIGEIPFIPHPHAPGELLVLKHALGNREGFMRRLIESRPDLFVVEGEWPSVQFRLTEYGTQVGSGSPSRLRAPEVRTDSASTPWPTDPANARTRDQLLHAVLLTICKAVHDAGQCEGLLVSTLGQQLRQMQACLNGRSVTQAALLDLAKHFGHASSMRFLKQHPHLFDTFVFMGEDAGQVRVVLTELGRAAARGTLSPEQLLARPAAAAAPASAPPVLRRNVPPAEQQRDSAPLRPQALRFDDVMTPAPALRAESPAQVAGLSALMSELLVTPASGVARTAPVSAPQHQAAASSAALPSLLPPAPHPRPTNGIHPPAHAGNLDALFFPLIAAAAGPAATSERERLLTTMMLSSVDAARHQEAGRSTGLLGCLHTASQGGVGVHVHLNNDMPFTLLTVGLQGTGKSHTVNALLENFLLNLPPSTPSELAPLRGVQSGCAVVFHYDQDALSLCESAALTLPGAGGREYHLPRESLTVLVSPSYYKQRERQYTKYTSNVFPLLLDWKDLDAATLRTLMGLEETENQLYVQGIMTLLRRQQKREQLSVSFEQFEQDIQDELMSEMSPSQRGPLEQRLKLLQSLLRGTVENADFRNFKVLKEVLEGVDRQRGSRLVIVDLSDPMTSGSEANNIFQVVVAALLRKTATPKLLAFDEAHKYFTATGKDALSRLVLSAVRQMRHKALRVIVSTQSPRSIPAEFFELLSALVIHRFSAEDWFTFLCGKVPHIRNEFETVLRLPAGQALVYAPKWSEALQRLHDGLQHDRLVHRVHVRARLTQDEGRSINASEAHAQ